MEDEPDTFYTTHFTEFTYVVGLVEDAYKVERLYNSPIVYILMMFDLYLLLTLVMGVIYYKEIKSKKIQEIVPSSLVKEKEMALDDDTKQNMKEISQDHFVVVGGNVGLDTVRSGNGLTQVNGVPKSKNAKKVSCPMICLMGIPFKCRMITPFTTSHDYLGRFGRGIVNISVLYMIWAFSGLIIDLGDYIPQPGYYFISFFVCFIVARIFTFLMDMLMSKTRFLAIRVIKYIVGLSIVVVLHAPILFFTVHMGDEFLHWGMTAIILLFLELFVWETISMCFQLPILLVL
jgi:hypothetical protein